MKLIIDIPEDTKNRLCFGITYQKDIQTICEVLNNGTPIPDNATNGEVLKALFPNERIGHCDDCTDLGDIATFDDDWWNALYQKGGKE